MYIANKVISCRREMNVLTIVRMHERDAEMFLDPAMG
jgi:hypothetical protein